MKTQRIFILSSQTLLARGVGKLLTGQRGLRVVGTETDPWEGIQHIRTSHPDVVILGGGNGGPPSLAVVSAVFEASPGTTVIGLSLGENLLHVYEDNQIKVARVEDLLQAIRQATVSRFRTAERAVKAERS